MDTEWTEFKWDLLSEDEQREEAYRQSAPVRAPEDVLSLFVEALRRSGVVGEADTARLVYLILTTRVLARPVSAVLTGASSTGKSWLLGAILTFFPPSAFVTFSGMSARAIVYSPEKLAHRFLVLYEVAGLQSNVATYFLRTLLSEGELKYHITTRASYGGFRSRTITKDGPTGVLMTTTAIEVEPEIRTRLLLIPVTDTPEQTRAVLTQLAQPVTPDGDELRTWRMYQRWIDGAEHRVVLPFASALATLLEPRAVRLRRDFSAVLSLVRAHAILHQEARSRTAAGEIRATLTDYAAVQRLVEPLVAEGVEVSVPPIVRETVVAVRKLAEGPSGEATLKAVAAELGIDSPAALRRVRLAMAAGFLVNLEARRSCRHRLTLGEPLPARDHSVLPSPDHPDLIAAAEAALEEDADLAFPFGCDAAQEEGPEDTFWETA